MHTGNNFRPLFTEYVRYTEVDPSGNASDLYMDMPESQPSHEYSEIFHGLYQFLQASASNHITGTSFHVLSNLFIIMQSFDVI
jgi:hypothetical protein